MHTMQNMQIMQNNTTETIEYMPFFSILNAHHHSRNKSTLIHIYGYSLIITFLKFFTKQKIRRSRRRLKLKRRDLLDANHRNPLHSSKWRK